MVQLHFCSLYSASFLHNSAGIARIFRGNGDHRTNARVFFWVGPICYIGMGIVSISIEYGYGYVMGNEYFTKTKAMIQKDIYYIKLKIIK